MRKNILYNLTILFLIMCNQVMYSANLRIYSGEYTSMLGENETLLKVKQITSREAMRNAVEKAGTFIISLSEVDNYQLVEDIIRTYSANIAKVLEENYVYTINNNQISVKAQVCVEVDLDDLNKTLQDIIQNEKMKADLESLRSKNDELNGRIKSLKDSLYIVKSVEQKDQINSRIIQEYNKKKANENLAEAWIILAQESGPILSEGSTTEENRRKAEYLLLEALSLDPGNSEVYRTLGIIYMEDGNNAKAEDYFTKAIQEGPKSARNYYAVGLSLYSQRKLKEANANFQKAIEMDSTLWFALNMMGVCQYEMGDIDQAIDFYRRTLAINPKHLGAKYNLGICYYYHKEYELALSEFLEYKENAKDLTKLDHNYIIIADSLINKIKTFISNRDSGVRDK